MNKDWNKIKEGEELPTLAKIVIANVGKTAESGKMLGEIEGYITSLIQQSKEKVKAQVQQAGADGRFWHYLEIESLIKKAKEEERERIGKHAEYIMEKAKCLTSNDCGLCLRGLQRKCDTAHTVALEHIFSTLTNKQNHD